MTAMQPVVRLGAEGCFWGPAAEDACLRPA
jgi:hypothetical protein